MSSSREMEHPLDSDRLVAKNDCMNLPLDPNSPDWNALADYLDHYIQTWEKGSVPAADLSPFLPDGPPALRRLVLIELAKIDLEYRYQKNASPQPVENYLEKYPELTEPDGIPCDLIYEEYHVRTGLEMDLDVAEFYERFPAQKEALQGLLGKETVLGSTRLSGRQPPIRELQAGEQLDDFELILRLGQGSFGSVFLARQLSMQRLVALKVSAGDSREPQTLAQLDHPNIVRVFDQRVLPDEPMRLLYMQFAAGGTLAQVIKELADVPIQDRSGRSLLDVVNHSVEQSGQLPAGSSSQRRELEAADWVTVVCGLGIQLAEALSYAHQRTIYHRDIKPANVLLSAEGTALLADFNVSFNSQLDGPSATAFLGGTLTYMSPEQLEACNPTLSTPPQEVDGRSDLFSLGIVLWELLLGEHPFEKDRFTGGWLTTLKEMARRRQTALPQIPAKLAGNSQYSSIVQVLSKCLSADPQERYQSGEEFVEALQLCLQPRARKLLMPERGWQQLARHQPVPTLLLAILGPNALAALFNLLYNQQEIVARVSADHATAFYRSVLWVNGVVFPFVIFLGYIASWRLRQRLQEDLQPPPDADRRSEIMRWRVLNYGNLAVLVGTSLWVIVGILFPLSMHISAGKLSATVYGHFFVSMSLCAAIAAAYPFFFVSFISIRVFYPSLLNGRSPPSGDHRQLKRIAQHASSYLLLAGAVPLVGVALLAFSQSNNLLAQTVFSLGGLFGFLLAFRMHRLLQLDIAALVQLKS